MFSELVNNSKKINKNIEPFIGNKTKSTFNLISDKSISEQLDISNDQRNELESSFMNNVQTNIKVKNSTMASLKVAAENNFILKNIKCTGTINIGNVLQFGDVSVSSQTVSQNKTENNVKTDIDIAVSQTMEQQMPDMGPFLDHQKQNLENFYKGTSLDYAEVGKAAKNAAKGAKATGVGNKSNSTVNITDNTNVSNAVGITNDSLNSTKVTNENTMMNTMESENKTYISDVILATNNFVVEDIVCGNFNIDSVKQIAKVTANIQKIIQNMNKTEIIQKFASTIDNVFKGAKNELKGEFELGYDNFVEKRIELLNKEKFGNTKMEYKDLEPMRNTNEDLLASIDPSTCYVAENCRTGDSRINMKSDGKDRLKKKGSEWVTLAGLQGCTNTINTKDNMGQHEKKLCAEPLADDAAATSANEDLLASIDPSTCYVAENCRTGDSRINMRSDGKDRLKKKGSEWVTLARLQGCTNTINTKDNMGQHEKKLCAEPLADDAAATSATDTTATTSAADTTAATSATDTTAAPSATDTTAAVGMLTAEDITGEITKENHWNNKYNFFVSEDEWEQGMIARGDVLDGIETATLAATACDDFETQVRIKTQYPDFKPAALCDSVKDKEPTQKPDDSIFPQIVPLDPTPSIPLVLNPQLPPPSDLENSELIQLKLEEPTNSTSDKLEEPTNSTSDKLEEPTNSTSDKLLEFLGEYYLIIIIVVIIIIIIIILISMLSDDDDDDDYDDDYDDED